MRSGGRWRALGAAVSLALLCGCSRGRSSVSSEDGAAEGVANPFPPQAFSGAFAPPYGVTPPVLAPAPPPRKGMVWIPPGALVAGTPTGRTPRVPDEEMRGEQVILHGFYMDEYPYPNEAAAIPKTGVSRDEASVLCGALDKRLCGELEWERACKGPANTTYEYGDVYRAGECRTGVPPRLVPAGLMVGCKSGFEVHDLHGGAWEWTSSPWGRGTQANLVAVRGGNADAGELVARCANAMGRAPSVKKPDIGWRCCAGEPNHVEVTLNVIQGKPLSSRVLDPAIAAVLEREAPAVAGDQLPEGSPFRVDRMWLWRPVGNEELVVSAGCAKGSGHLFCGVIVARMDFDTPVPIAFASSGKWMVVVKTEGYTRDLRIYGGDDRGNFHRRVAYVWGRISVGDPERKKPADDE